MSSPLPKTLLNDLNKELISEIQERLISLRLLYPPVDGLCGPNTRRAWGEFKKLVHMNEPDYIGNASLNALRDMTKALPKYTVDKALVEKGFKNDMSDSLYKDLISCLNIFSINTDKRVCHFLAQVGHETAGLRFKQEIASGKNYEFRKDLGNIYPGDGVRFKGAGALQLTGRFWYEEFAEHMEDDLILQGSEYVSQRYFFSSGGFWWERNSMNKLCDNNASVEMVTRRVNGGYNGLQDRIEYYKRFKALLGRK